MASAMRTDGRSGRPATVTSLGALAFAPAAAVPALDDTIDLWLCQTHATDPRAARMRTRAALDALLQAYAGAPVRIATGANGKPLAADHPQLDFNLSHTGSTAVFAFARAQPLGVDVERRDRRVAVEGIARRFFAASEAAALAALATERRHDAFIDLWTCKEAVLKARGEGLSFGLERVELELDAAGNVAALAHLHGDDARAWRIVRFRPAPGLAACLAWRGAARPLRAFRCFP